MDSSIRSRFIYSSIHIGEEIMVSYEDFEVLIIIVIFSVIGIIMAMFLKTLYDLGIIVDEFVSETITINELMAIVIILFLVVGVVIAATKK